MSFIPYSPLYEQDVEAAAEAGTFGIGAAGSGQ